MNIQLPKKKTPMEIIASFPLVRMDSLTKPCLKHTIVLGKHNLIQGKDVPKIRFSMSILNSNTLRSLSIKKMGNWYNSKLEFVMELQKHYQQTLADKPNGLRLLDYLFTQPFITVGDITKLLDIAYPTANNLVKILIQRSILQEVTGQSRNRKFVMGEYLNILSEDLP